MGSGRWRMGGEGVRSLAWPESGWRHALGGMDGIGRLLTAAEVAERLGFTERYVWRLGREGVLPRIKVPGRKYVRFCVSDVERFVREGRRAAEASRPRSVGSAARLPSRV